MAIVQHVHAYCSTFFFQAEDGIRDVAVTGVQTCALPIYSGLMAPRTLATLATVLSSARDADAALTLLHQEASDLERSSQLRSEERRVGKECRSRCSPYDL